jgi:hypothetical protein
MEYVLVKKLSRYHHAGTNGENMHSSYSFLNSALDGGEMSASRPGPALSPGKDPQHPLDRRDDVTGEWRSCTMRSFRICTHPEVPLGRSKKEQRGGRVMWHARKRSEKVGRPEGKRPLGRPRLRWEDGIRMDLWDTGCEGCRVNSFGSR